MSFFKTFNFFNNDLAIDLGTANTVIWKNGKIAMSKPSIVAIDKDSDRIYAIGDEAKAMIGKTHQGIEIIKPMKEGVIANPRIAETMLRIFIREVAGNFARRIIVCVPAGVTEAEKMVVRDSCEQAGAKEVHLITEPMAGAIGLDLDVLGANGNMIVDIGGGTTEIAVIALGGIVCNQSIKVAGNVLTESIQQYLQTEHQLMIGENTAEFIKMNIGSAYPMEDEKNITIDVKGKAVVNGIPKAIKINPAEIREKALAAPIQNIINAVLKLLNDTPPDLAKDIFDRGINLSGGGANLIGLDKRIANATKLPVHVAEEPLFAVVRGVGKVLDDVEKYRSVLLKHNPSYI